MLRLWWYFNSTLVRLKDDFQAKVKGLPRLFQFHIGTIKSITLPQMVMIIIDFNSTLVRLKAARRELGSKGQTYFNSTLVRLKGDRVKESDAIRLFQFHIGTIKSLLLQIIQILFHSFQFHIGTIKRAAAGPVG